MENVSNYITEILILIFLIVTFLQSGLDKLFDWKGNTGWLKDHFGKTFLKDAVPLMVGIILITEVLTGILGIIGVLEIIFYGTTEWALCATILGALTLIMLLFGQRVAKDYAGAFTLTGYFIINIFGVYLLS
ncbi:MAG TPA: DoxX family protein [Salinimicrobium sp.]|nr:DoxX family protein [Salinimicrobium sp.]